jgi:hypothetical protein
MPCKENGKAHIKALPEVPQAIWGAPVTTAKVIWRCPKDHVGCRVWEFQEPLRFKLGRTNAAVLNLPERVLLADDDQNGTDETIRRAGLPPILTEEMVLATRTRAPEKEQNHAL